MKRGFTLAEVLITLGIIGVVAALVMPGLIAEYKKRTYVTGLQKFYSVLQNGLALYKVKEDASELNDTELIIMMQSGSVDKTELNSIIGTIFNKAVSCDTQSDKKCSGVKYKALDGNDYSPFGTGLGSFYTFVLPDSTIVSIRPVQQCDVNAPLTNRNGRCIDIYVDVNGKKGPNINGRDLFVVGIRADGKVVPSSYYSTASAEGISPSVIDSRCLTPVAAGGIWYADVCAAKIINDGWVMDY